LPSPRSISSHKKRIAAAGVLASLSLATGLAILLLVGVAQNGTVAADAPARSHA
jgi:hypothetical protein